MTPTPLPERPWWVRISAYARGSWRRLLLLVVAQFALAGLVALGPWPAKLIVDSVLAGAELPEAWHWLADLPGGNSPEGLLWVLAAATVLVFLASQAVASAQHLLQTTTARRVTYKLAQDALEQVQRQSIVGLQRHSRGDLLARVDRDARCAEDLVFGVGLAAVAALAELIVVAVIMVQVSPLLATASLVVLVPLVWRVRRGGAAMSALATAEGNAEGALMGGAERTLRMLPEVHSFTAEDREAATFRGLATDWWRAGIRLQGLFVRFEVGVTAVTAAAAALVLGIGGLLVLERRLTVGDLVVFNTYIVALRGPLSGLAELVTSLAHARARALRILELWAEETAITDPSSPVAFPPAGRGARVELRDVTVGYEPGRPVLSELSLTVEAGQTVALVGPSGAGKTTLVSLLPRFLDPWQGRVVLDGVDVRQARVGDVRRRVALVRQDPILLPVSIADNIAYGRPEASRAEVEAAAQAANAAEFIERLPDGYDTVVAEGGASLSGGQRQRLAIARAFLKDAPLLVLDEPTAALDTASETLLVDALARISAHRTVFVIAHRLSTIRNADVIVVLDAGRLVAQGTHDHLLHHDPLYARLHAGTGRGVVAGGDGHAAP